MSDKIKRMDIGEFVDQGFLQEANRLFFHPLGLALEVVIDEKINDVKLGGIWDYRDEPEGIVFGELINKKKIKNVQKLLNKKSKERKKLLGYIIQTEE